MQENTTKTTTKYLLSIFVCNECLPNIEVRIYNKRLERLNYRFTSIIIYNIIPTVKTAKIQKRVLARSQLL